MQEGADQGVLDDILCEKGLLCVRARIPVYLCPMTPDQLAKRIAVSSLCPFDQDFILFTLIFLSRLLIEHGWFHCKNSSSVS
ncbi:Uncharacterised protein [Mycobacterium tuberculosis]|nr:Uncharacterised protein [Mycobacterium tuberculosis]